MRRSGGRILLWNRHYAKLAADCIALKLDCPAAKTFEADFEKIAALRPDGVIRISVTRGIAQRGYAIPERVTSSRIVLWSALSPVGSVGGIRVRWCNLRLGTQPALAGIKHLNRLENVLARSEWRDPAISEGLMCDAEGRVIGGTMSNLFLLRGKALVTPELDKCGVAGVIRGLIIERARAEKIEMRVEPVSTADVRFADAVFVVNSVLGVKWVAALEDVTWGTHPFYLHMRSWISNAENDRD